jgi:lipopolysaccharide transport system ATP-binding protein
LPTASDRNSLAIRVSEVGKHYRIGVARGPAYRTLRDSIADVLRSRSRSREANSPSGDETSGSFWALKNVTFDVRRGEVVGIIGRNGAGKSTLLKILSRTTDPTLGEVEIVGRVGSLLEVGTGFHPELTGRENIYLNGAILGMRRAEIARKFDEIVAFSEVETFLDTPAKHYSSGMYMRLAFAVAAHLEPETLIVDEVLAVGDAAFQAKCLGKMGNVAKEGRTVLFVSHNIGAIKSLCTRCIVLRSGKLQFDGTPNEAIAWYLAENTGEIKGSEGLVRWSTDAPEGADLRLAEVRLLDQSGQVRGTYDSDEPVRVEIFYDVKSPLRGARMSILISTQEGELAFMSSDHVYRDSNQSEGRYVASCTIPGKLLNRRMYVVGVNCDIPGVKVVLPTHECLSFVVSGAGNHGSNFPEGWPGAVCPQLTWQVRRL